MLTRIYGTAFFSQGRPRRAPGAPGGGARARPPQARQRAGPVLVLRGLARLAVLAARRAWRSGTRSPTSGGSENAARGYREVRTPILYDVDLWKQSGHWDNYRDNMYFTEVEDRQMGLKPMNCPAHIQIYKSDAPLLPRPADALCRGRPRPPPRAQRDAARAAARAPHHPGRRATSSAPRSRSRTRSSAAWTFGFFDLRRVRLRAASSSSRRGPRSAWARTRCGTAPRPRWRPR